MSLSFVVNIKGKKVTVKASPATSPAQIINDACKQSFDLIRHNGKELDRALPCRLLGLVSGAKLDAKILNTSSAALIRVAVQLPSTERVQHQFSSNDSLAHILQFIGYEYDSNTKVNYLNTEIHNDKFESTTLSSLGLTQGSGLLRIIGGSGSVTPTSSRSPTQSTNPPVSPNSSPIIPSQPVNSAIGSPISPTLHSTSTPTTTSPTIPNSTISPPTVSDQVNTQLQDQHTQLIERNTNHSHLEMIESDKLSIQDSRTEHATDNGYNTFNGHNKPTEHNKLYEHNDHVDVHMEEVGNNSTVPNLPLGNFSTSNSPNTSVNNNDKNETNINISNDTNNNSSKTSTVINTPQQSEQLYPPLLNSKDNTPILDIARYSIPDRNLQVFVPNETTGLQTRDLPDSFYAHTAEDAQELARIEQKRRQEMLDNQVLKTKAMREAERQQKAFKFSKTVIRVRFPDRTELQGEFAPQEEISSLLQFVRENLEDVQKLEKGTFESLGLCPSALVLFSRTDKTTIPPFLKPSLRPSPKLGDHASKPQTTAANPKLAPMSDAAKKEMEARLMSKYFGKKK